MKWKLKGQRRQQPPLSRAHRRQAEEADGRREGTALPQRAGERGKAHAVAYGGFGWRQQRSPWRLAGTRVPAGSGWNCSSQRALRRRARGCCGDGSAARPGLRPGGRAPPRGRPQRFPPLVFLLWALRGPPGPGRPRSREPCGGALPARGRSLWLVEAAALAFRYKHMAGCFCHALLSPARNVEYKLTHTFPSSVTPCRDTSHTQ